MGRSELDKAFALIAIRLKRHIDSIGPSANDTSVKKRVWNSLEAAKIFVGVLTSVSVAGLGYIITTTNTDRQFEYEKSLRKEASDRDKEVRKEVRDHQDKLAADARVADAKVRADAKAADAKARAEAAVEARRASSEAFARELALKQQSDEREAAIRADLRAEARLSKMHDQRMQGWEKIAPSGAKMRESATNAVIHSQFYPERLPALHDSFISAADEFQQLSRQYSAYFSDDYRVSLGYIALAIGRFRLEMLKKSVGDPANIHEVERELSKAYIDFERRVEVDLRLGDQ